MPQTHMMVMHACRVRALIIEELAIFSNLEPHHVRCILQRHSYHITPSAR